MCLALMTTVMEASQEEDSPQGMRQVQQRRGQVALPDSVHSKGMVTLEKGVWKCQ
jgi:hypothetical protein